MVVFDDTIYLEKGTGYVRCDLRKSESGIYSLEPTDEVIKRLNPKAEFLTWTELLARYSRLAIPATPQRRVTRATVSKEA